ncbi:MAG TPA: adenylate/guanylate cyclase domain-containing protein [Acidimicrobiia bacterium]|nr:adenylate/guanylate cyclase domain-containing protein [Acidimicrobiia bacterium]
MSDLWPDLGDDPGPRTTNVGLVRRSWWRIYRGIDRAVGRDADTDTRRFQKVLVVVAALVGSLATVFNALSLFQGDLTASGWVYVLSAVVLASGGLALLQWPGRYVAITWVLLLDVLVFSSLVQVLSGGMTSGLAAIPWAIFAPLGAALALDSRHSAIHLGLFVVVLIVVAIIDPWARTIAPEVTPDALLAFNVPSLLSLGVMAGVISIYLLRQLERSRATAHTLLLNVLPEPIARRLQGRRTTIADRFENVTVLFADIVGFTPLASGLDAEAIVSMLNSVFSEFDDLAAKHGVMKIKTIGDSYMAAAGLLDSKGDQTVSVIDLGLDMLDAVASDRSVDGNRTRLRIGIHTGPVVAGVIGHDRFIYDLWGDTVNVASRMESSGITDRIQVSEAVVAAVGDRYQFERRDSVVLKGKGPTTTYLLVRPDE